MIALVLIADLAAQAPPAVPAEPERRCRAAIAARAGGEISQFTVSRVRHLGRQTVLTGTLNALKRPPTRAGEMTPTHIVNMRYSFECRLSGHRTPRIKMMPLNE